MSGGAEHVRSTSARSYLQLISVRIDSPPANRHVADAGNADRLIVGRNEMHLDAVQRAIVERAMLERAEVEVGAKVAVQHSQHVEVELRRHALRSRCTLPR